MANTIADFFIGIGADMSAFEKEMGDLKNSMKDVGDKFTSLGESMTAAFTLPLVAVGGVAAKGASDVQAAQGKIQASLGLTEEQSKQLMGTAREVWKQGFGENVGEAADAVATVQKNIQGLNESDLQRITENAFALRDVFGAEVTQSTKTAGVMMKNFGIDADKAMDLMTVGFQKGGDFSDELLDTMNEYSPMFSSMGMSAEDMMNILISGAQAGAFNLDKVGDAVKEFNIRAKDGSKATAEGFEMLGLNANKMGADIAAGGEKGKAAFNATIAALAAMEDPVKRNTAGVALFGTQWEDLEADVITAMTTSTDHLGNYEGAAGRAGAAFQDNFGERLQKTLRTLQDALLPLGTVLLDMADAVLPIITTAAEVMGRAFADIPAPIQGVIAILGMLLAAAGPILLIAGKLMTAWADLAPVLTKIGPAINIVRTALTALTGPVGIIIAIVAALAVAIYKNWDEISAKTKEVFEFLGQFLPELWGSIKETAVEIFSAIGEFLSNLWTDIKETAVETWQSISDAATTIFTAIGDFLKNLWQSIKDAATVIFDGLKTYFTTVLNIYKTVFTTIWNAIVTGVSTLFDKLKNAAQTVFNALKTFFTNALNFYKNTFITIWTAIFSGVAAIYNALKNGITTVFNAIKNFLVTVWTNTKNSVVNLVQSLYQGAINTFNLMKNGITTVMNSIFSTIKNIWTNILNTASKWVGNFKDIGLDIIKGLWDGLKGSADWLWEKVKGMLGTLTDKIKDFFGIASPSKLFKEYGSWLSQGLAIGIEADARLATDTALEMAQGVAENAQPDIPGGGGAFSGYDMAGLMDAIASMGSGGDIIIQHMEVRDDSDIRAVSRELYSLQETNRRSKGGR